MARPLSQEQVSHRKVLPLRLGIDVFNIMAKCVDILCLFTFRIAFQIIALSGG